MDPVSHMAFGRTLVAVDGSRRLGAGAIAACVIGSLAPDVDALFMPAGWDVYLRRHQGGTHSLIGALAAAMLVAALIKAWLPRGRFPGLLLAAGAGTAGHLLLDVTSGADIGFFWPLGPVIALPLFAMADPWLGGLLVAGLAALMLSRRDARIAVAILFAVAALAAGKGLLYARALARDDASSHPAPVRRAEAAWGSLTRWVIYDAPADIVRSRRVDAVTGEVTPLVTIARGLDNPLVVRSLELTTVQNFRAAHRITFAIVIDRGADGRQVLWSDLRYCGPPRHGSLPWSPIDLGGAAPLSCALWFGGEFDRAGEAAASVVWVGQHAQRRVVR